MDMSINLTLLVQIGNFLIAYVVLSYFFFRPGYHSVRRDEERLRKIKSHITARQELIAHKQEHKHSRWRLFQDYFNKQKPDIHEETKLAHPFKGGLGVPELTKEELTRLSTEVVLKIKDLV